MKHINLSTATEECLEIVKAFETLYGRIFANEKWLLPEELKPEKPKLDLSEEIERASDSLHRGESARINYVVKALKKIQDHINNK